MSILILTSNQHPLVMNEYKYLKILVPEIMLLSLMPVSQLLKSLLLSSKVLILNVKYVLLFTQLFGHLDKFPIHHLIYWYMHLLYILVLDRKYSFEVIHAHWLYPGGLIATTYSKVVPTHVVITSHGYDADERTFSKPKLTKLVIEVGLRANKIITAERRLYENLTSHDLDNVILTNNFVELYKYSLPETSGVRKELNIEKDKFVVLFGPRISKIYGALDFAEAIVILDKVISNLFVICLGKAETDYVEKLFLEHGIRYRLTGNINNEDVFNYLEACDVVCNLGYMGQGIFTLEAFACGKPAIGFYDVGEVKIEDGVTGLLSKSGDIEGIAKCVLRLYNDGNLRKLLAMNARKTIETKYSLQKRMRDILDSYK